MFWYAPMSSTHINSCNVSLFGTPNTCNYTYSWVKYKINTILVDIVVLKKLFKMFIYFYYVLHKKRFVNLRYNWFEKWIFRWKVNKRVITHGTVIKTTIRNMKFLYNPVYSWLLLFVNTDVFGGFLYV